MQPRSADVSRNDLIEAWGMRTCKGGKEINLQSTENNLTSLSNGKSIFIQISPQSGDILNRRCGHYKMIFTKGTVLTNLTNCKVDYIATTSCL